MYIKISQKRLSAAAKGIFVAHLNDTNCGGCRPSTLPLSGLSVMQSLPKIVALPRVVALRFAG